ncbi:MAG TPA: hypothetical protein VF190_05625, partial [Rhodothermales bacterium]
VERVSASPVAMRRMRIGRFVFVGLVLVYLAYRLTSIGWGSVVASLPTTPFFYGLVLVMYFLLPCSEALIYSRIWGTAYRKCLAPLLYKRVLNQDVVDYSGEVYLFMWTKGRIALTKRAIAATMKDNLIVSSIVSISTAVALLGFLLVTGLIIPTDLVHDPSWMYVVGGAVIAGFLGGLIARFRKAIFSLPRRQLVEMGGIHTARFFLGYALQVLQWWVVVPEASFQSWALLLVLMVVTNRIPFLPSKDLVFVGAGVEMSAMLDVPAAAVASMLLVRSLSDKLLNLAIFTVFSLRREDPAKSTTSPEENGALAPYNVAPATDKEVPALDAG